jgi:prevent-host-death family protein
MRRTSLADAKAHLSALVDRAEHHGDRIVILRHGKPAAAIVPVEVAQPKRRRRKPMAAAEAKALLDDLAKTGSPEGEAVRDVIESRR